MQPFKRIAQVRSGRKVEKVPATGFHDGCLDPGLKLELCKYSALAFSNLNANEFGAPRQRVRGNAAKI